MAWQQVWIQQMGDVHSGSTRQIIEKSKSKSDTCGLDTANNKEATTNNSRADWCYPRQKISVRTYHAVAEYNIAHHHMHGILARPSTASDEIKAAHGSHQSCKTCTGADELTFRTLLRDEAN